VSLSCGAVLKWATGPCAGKASGETSMLRDLAHGFGAGDLAANPLLKLWYTHASFLRGEVRSCDLFLTGGDGRAPSARERRSRC